MMSFSRAMDSNVHVAGCLHATLVSANPAVLLGSARGNALGLTPIHCIPSLPAQTSNNICVEYSFIGGPAVITLYRAVTTSRSKARAELLRRIGRKFGPVS